MSRAEDKLLVNSSELGLAPARKTWSKRASATQYRHSWRS